MLRFQLIYWAITAIIILAVFINGNKYFRRLFLLAFILTLTSCGSAKLTLKHTPNYYVVHEKK